jgi:hypothetical protein
LRAIEKFEAKQTPLVDESVIGDNKEGSITQKVIKLVHAVKAGGHSADKLSVPHILVITPDTYVVVDVCKELKAKFADNK